MPTICITGGTGLIGTALSNYLAGKGHRIIILSRSPKKSANELITFANWDIENGLIDKEAIASADYIIHLAGAGVAEKRWTKKRKKEILNSRIQSSAFLVEQLKETPNHVKAVISTSAIGWYGPNNHHPFKEDEPAFTDFLGNTCKQWEASIEPVKNLSVKLVKLRIGIVLSNDGGALKEFKKPIGFGLATILGSGKQIISWIHIDDLCRMFEFVMENENADGVYNAVAPNPVSNQVLTLALAKKMKGNLFITIPVPAFSLKLILGEMSVEVLKSTTVSSSKIQNLGFQFAFPTIDAALNQLINPLCLES